MYGTKLFLSILVVVVIVPILSIAVGSPGG